MFILILQDFNDSRDKFYRGEVRFVEDARAAVFVSYGWAEDASKPGATGESQAGSVSLDIQNGTLGVRDTNDG